MGRIFISLMRGALPGLSASLAIAIMGFATAASSEDSSTDLASSWLGSAEFGISADREKRTAETFGTISPLSKTSEHHVTSIRFGGQMQGPEIERVWFKPRPFASAGLLYVIASHRIEAGDYQSGQPDEFLTGIIDLPESPSDPNATGDALMLLDPEDIPGTGFLVDHKTNPNPGAYADIGLAFSAPLPLGWPGWVSLRPALEYNLRNYRLRGEGYEVVEPIPDTFEVTRNIDTRSFSEHRLGPALEFELGFGSEKSFGMAFLFGVRWLFLVSDDDRTWGQRDTISSSIYDVNTVIPAGESGSAGKVFGFRTEADDLVFSMGGGIRIHWY